MKPVDTIQQIGKTKEAAMEETPVKVAVRVRPRLSREILHNHQVCVRVVPNTQQVVIGKDRVFTFDFVFGNKSTQDDVYTNCIKPLVVSLIEGYNATVFAYGQTGSGKTYTIGGGHMACVAEEEKGIIPRAIQELFQSISENSTIDFSVKVSYIEVYKEELKDLLELDTSVKDLHIREDDKGNTVIVGAKECQVESADDLISLLETGNAARHTSITQMNEHSSRSHAIFTISICQQRTKEPQKNSETDVDRLLRSVQMISSKFHFVDLAGSERVTKTGNTGERFKESIQINSGLLALGNVISALGDPKRKSAHIPYRDAKITRILKDSLGGNAKTVMIACISPSSSDFDESLNSLKYANRARNIKNKPIVNYNPDWDRMDEMELEIKALREALQNQRASVMAQASQVSQDWTLDKTRIRSLEEQLAQFQLECFNYRTLIEDAFTFLFELKDMVSMRRSLQLKLQEWLNMAEGLRLEMAPSPGIDSGIATGREEPYHITILQLKRDLKKCQDALASDEEVFSQKELDLKNLQEQIQGLTQENQEHLLSLKEAEQMHTLQNEKMIEQQLLIEELQDKLMKLTASQQTSEDTLVPLSFQRPYSVPLTHNSQLLSNSLIKSLQMPAMPKARKVHTSPPMYSLDRVVAGFRTRSQMVIDHLEQQDEVLHCQFSDQSDEDDDDNNKENRKKSSFRRSINRTWTRKQAPVTPAQELSTLQCQIPKQNEPISPAETTRDVEGLQHSQIVNMKNLRHSELRLNEAKQKMREISINIKMKEELIKELIKTGKDAHFINKRYSLKISKLGQEAEQAKKELAETQKQLQELENLELRDFAQRTKLQKDFRKKMDVAKLKVQVLQKKQQDTKKLASLSSQNEKRVAELEQNVDHMRQQQTQLQKKLREEMEKKRKLEAEIQRDQQQIKDLQLKMEQQQKILKLKNEEIASIRKRKTTATTLDQLQKLEEQKKWLDEEVEKVLHQRQVLNELEGELKKRETAMAKREALLQEKSHLEIKKLRSSQALSKDLLKLSSRLSVLDQELSDKSLELQSSGQEEKRKIAEEVQVLQKEMDLLLRRRGSLDEKLKNGRVLSPEEEHNLFQLEEGIEALEAAIDFRNESIQSCQHSLKSTSQILSQSEANVMGRFSSLSPSEIKSILIRYFNKVVGLREAERKLQLQLEEMEMKNVEQENIMHELQSAVEHLTLQNDRRLTLLQKEQEQKMQVLLQHFAEHDGDGVAESIKTYEAKVQQLEKDLFFYKNSSRELKKKLKELVGDMRPQQLPSVKHNGTGDGIQVQEETGTLTEALRWLSKLDKTNGKLKEIDTGATGLRIHQHHHRNWGDISDTPQSPAMVELSKRHLSSEDQVETEEVQSSKPPTHVLSHSQTIENITLLQGKTPVKVSRRELRQISASELSMRRSSLGTSGSIAADSIEISRKSTDFKT